MYSEARRIGGSGLFERILSIPSLFGSSVFSTGLSSVMSRSGNCSVASPGCSRLSGPVAEGIVDVVCAGVSGDTSCGLSESLN